MKVTSLKEYTLFLSSYYDFYIHLLLVALSVYVIQLTEGHATWSVLLWRSFGLNTLWTLNLYCIVRSLRHISVTDMTILICVLPPYGYLFSWILVPKKFVAFRVCLLSFSQSG